jgi:hypothetical protein
MRTNKNLRPKGSSGIIFFNDYESGDENYMKLKIAFLNKLKQERSDIDLKIKIASFVQRNLFNIAVLTIGFLLASLIYLALK